MLINGNKKIIIIIIAACLLTASGAGLYYFKKNNKPAEPSKKTEPTTIEKKLEPVGTPTTNETIKKATKAKDPRLCDGLPVTGRDECYYIILLNIRDIAQCAKITDEKIRTRCANEINFAEAIEGGGAKDCLPLADTRLKEECLRTKFRGNGDLALCSDYKDPTAVNLCESNVYSKMAYEAGRPGDCEKVKDEVLKFDCLTMVKNKPKDSDGDSLSDDYEIMILSNPLKSDTDGDGCKDGDEKKSGHSPIVKDTGSDCLKNR